jgi:hypothetical protein
MSRHDYSNISSFTATHEAGSLCMFQRAMVQHVKRIAQDFQTSHVGMAESTTSAIWDALQYLSPIEFTHLEAEFGSALKDTSCRVFWTGVPRGVVQHCAEENGAKTLTSAMGSLFDGHGLSRTRHEKSPKRWSRYLKVASGLIALYFCHESEYRCTSCCGAGTGYPARAWSRVVHT